MSVQRLKELAQSLANKENLQVGDIVKWKDGLQTRRTADEMIITAVGLDAASESESGSIYFREPLDVRVGMLDCDGDFVEYHLDSRRLTKVQ